MEYEIISPPRTIMEVYKMLPEGTMAELIEGQLYMSPAPTNRHQRVLIALFKTLDQHVAVNGLGEVFISPSDVYLDDHSNAVQPDLYFVSKKNKMVIYDDQPNRGVPDLVVEILSPSNNQHDLKIKKNLYEKFGVKEYWIIDPTTKEVSIYQLVGNQFVLAGKNKTKLFSPLFNHSFTI
ncbi:MAG: Uma2 family endonuclease [Cyclobacteriaceae bacterium]